jgi:hypothetical protein
LTFSDEKNSDDVSAVVHQAIRLPDPVYPEKRNIIFDFFELIARFWNQDGDAW